MKKKKIENGSKNDGKPIKKKIKKKKALVSDFFFFLTAESKFKKVFEKKKK
jgi:hypothetical protein